MPLLDQADIQRLIDKPGKACLGCGALVKRNYCRECDEFFQQGHFPGCSEPQHIGHRMYDLNKPAEEQVGAALYT